MKTPYTHVECPVCQQVFEEGFFTVTHKQLCNAEANERKEAVAYDYFHSDGMNIVHTIEDQASSYNFMQPFQSSSICLPTVTKPLNPPRDMSCHVELDKLPRHFHRVKT
jgi:hypothetical protein